MANNKPKTNRKGSLIGEEPSDHCQTPSHAILPLLPFIRDDQLIWESAAGKRQMAEAFRSHGHEVCDTDVLDGINFFNYEPILWDVLVTNPPYSIKYPWLRRCYELGKPFALLVPVEIIGARKAQDLIVEHGAEFILFTKRINFVMPNKGLSGGGAQFPVLWWTWKFNIGKQLSIWDVDKEEFYQR